MTKNRTTTKHFQIFKKEARLWIDRFGLTNWEVIFYHEDDGDEELRGWMTAVFDHQIANIGLARSWVNSKVSVRGIKKTAFHEVVHLLLANFSILGQERWSIQKAYQAEEHAVIRRLEEFFYGSGEN